jgi:hypothetical protein
MRGQGFEPLLRHYLSSSDYMEFARASDLKVDAPPAALELGPGLLRCRTHRIRHLIRCSSLLWLGRRLASVGDHLVTTVSHICCWSRPPTYRMVLGWLGVSVAPSGTATGTLATAATFYNWAAQSGAAQGGQSFDGPAALGMVADNLLTLPGLAFGSVFAELRGELDSDPVLRP